MERYTNAAVYVTMNTILSKLGNASRSLRVLFVSMYVGLVIYKSKDVGMTNEDINNILYAVMALVAADSWRPLGVDTKSNETTTTTTT